MCTSLLTWTLECASVGHGYLPILAVGSTNENDEFLASFAASEQSEENKRFATVSSLELDQIEMNRCSSNTKKNRLHGL